MAGAGVTAQIVGSTIDPLFFTAFVPGLNMVGLGRTVGQAAMRYGAAGAAYGLASEARRAPFAVGDDEFESTTNIASAAIVSRLSGWWSKGHSGADASS